LTYSARFNYTSKVLEIKANADEVAELAARNGQLQRLVAELLQKNEALRRELETWSSDATKTMPQPQPAARDFVDQKWRS
jgi:hypothetical protein